jgi:hypothetical protein
MGSTFGILNQSAFSDRHRSAPRRQNPLDRYGQYCQHRSREVFRLSHHQLTPRVRPFKLREEEH